MHTDYGFRLLMLSAEASPETISVQEVAQRLGVSGNHLMKVAQNLAKAGWLEPVRGRSGGFRLAKQPQDVRVGDVVRTLESELGLVECMRSLASDCPLTPACRLPRLLRSATNAFFDVLDECTLADLVSDRRELASVLETA